MFAALEEGSMKPDIILSTCGGAIATAIINSFDTNRARKAYFQSEELFEFIRDIRLSQESRVHRIGFYCLRLLQSRKKAPYIRNIFDRYLVDMPEDITPFLPSLELQFARHIPSVMIGSELLFDKTDVEQPRGESALFRKVLFTDEQTARMIHPEAIEIRTESYKGSAVASSVRAETGVPVPLAMRISLSDMFYVQPVYYNNQYYAGGIIDLLPIELAEALAEQRIFEKKEPFTWLEEGLVRAVFGYNGEMSGWQKCRK
ncbi:MAG: patatin-like phospholipase family protein [Tannerellaceae bacterium]|nr:patatin-like phospholipase family protein [Tannerellaceae bacterium]